MLGGGFNYVGNGYSREYGFRLSTAYFFHLKKRNYLSLGLSYVTYRNNYIATVLQGNETNYTAIANYYYFLNQNLAAIVGLNYQSELSKFSQKDYDKFYTGLKYFIH